MSPEVVKTLCRIETYIKLEIRFVERGICPIATSTINERTVPIIVAGCMAHEREGYISTFGLKSDVTIVFLDPISYTTREFRRFGHK